MSWVVCSMTRLEDCLDGAAAVEYELSAPIEVSLVRSMAAGASLHYRPDFPRPYFRITRHGWYVVQGVVGNRTFRATFPGGASGQAVDELNHQVEEAAAGSVRFGGGAPAHLAASGLDRRSVRRG